MPFRQFDTTEAVKPITKQGVGGFRPIGLETKPESTISEDIQVISQPSFFERLAERLKIRQEKALEGFELEAAGKQSRLSSAFQATGQGFGFIGDIIGETLLTGIKVITPNFIEKGVSDSVRSIMNTPLGQKALSALNRGIEEYGKFREENPEFARNFESVLNIGMIALDIYGTRLGMKAGEEIISPTLKKGGMILKETGEQALEKERTSFIRELARPIQTKAVKEAQVGRTTEVGKGVFKKSIIEPTSQELRIEKYLAEIPEIKPTNTFQQNYNAIQKANRAEAKNLEATIKNNDFIFPKKELSARLRATKEELARNPVITGDAEKTAEKLIAEIERRVNAAPAKGSELLQIRKDFDIWVEAQKGGAAFDPVKENAFSIANREIRRTINTFLDEKAPTVGVKDSLRKQSSLFDALDNIKPKAAQEADTAIKRFLQRSGEILGTKSRIVQILAATVGIGGLGAAATFAPGAATVGIGGFLMYKAGRLILKPQVRKVLGDLLIEIEKVGTGKIVGGIAGIIPPSQINELRDEIQQFMEDYSELESSE